jgi:hypothetical protein
LGRWPGSIFLEFISTPGELEITSHRSVCEPHTFILVNSKKPKLNPTSSHSNSTGYEGSVTKENEVDRSSILILGSMY